MKICIPVDHLDNLQSPVAPSFRAAPALLVVDSVSMEIVVIDAESGICSATPRYAEDRTRGATPRHIDAIICAGGIGRGMFNGLRAQGIRVFNSSALTVEHALAELNGGCLEEVTEVECCGGDGHDHAHEHAHG